MGKILLTSARGFPAILRGRQPHSLPRTVLRVSSTKRGYTRFRPSGAINGVPKGRQLVQSREAGQAVGLLPRKAVVSPAFYVIS